MSTVQQSQLFPKLSDDELLREARRTTKMWPFRSLPAFLLECSGLLVVIGIAIIALSPLSSIVPLSITLLTLLLYLFFGLYKPAFRRYRQFITAALQRKMPRLLGPLFVHEHRADLRHWTGKDPVQYASLLYEPILQLLPLLTREDLQSFTLQEVRAYVEFQAPVELRVGMLEYLGLLGGYTVAMALGLRHDSEGITSPYAPKNAPEEVNIAWEKAIAAISERAKEERKSATLLRPAETFPEELLRPASSVASESGTLVRASAREEET